jgi:endoglucanase
MFTVMLVGHADKIRLPVRSVDASGRIYINSDSMLTQTLVGHDVHLFARAPGSCPLRGNEWRRFEGTVEALGAIHFAPAAMRSGAKGIAPDSLYVELNVQAAKKKEFIEQTLGIRPGDPLLFNRPLRRVAAALHEGGVAQQHGFYGGYLDNGLGVFATIEVARLVAALPVAFKHVRVLFAVATHEEIGRFGSRVICGEMKPDALIAVDVNHDYETAANIKAKNMPSLGVGKGFTITQGSITSDTLNSQIRAAADSAGIPYQLDARGNDTGTDGMAGFLASIDCASASIGFPIRSMHTISEAASTHDVLASIHATFAALCDMEKSKLSSAKLKESHTRLDLAEPIEQA